MLIVRMSTHPMLTLLFSLTVCASPAAAQAAPRGPAASVLYSGVVCGPLSVDCSAERRDSVVRDIQPTYWKEGAAAGGLVGAVGGALLGWAVCGMSDEVGKNCTGTTILGSVGGAVLLAIPGALIGGQFSKGSAENNSPSE